MRIEQVQFLNSNKVPFLNKEKNKEYTKPTLEANSLDVSGQYNVAFFGLFNRKKTIVEAIDATNLATTLQMEPNKKYKVNQDSRLELGKEGYAIPLDSPLMSLAMDILNKDGEVILGRSNLCLAGMDQTISRAHLKLTKDKNGQLYAEDMGSTNGTKIIQNIITPTTTQGSFKLSPNQKYIFPMNSVFTIADTTFSLKNYQDIFRNMQEGESVIAGRSPNSDIKINSLFASSKHLKLEKHKNGIMVRDLGSLNGTTFSHIEEKRADYKQDYSNITDKKILIKGESTLLPQNSQLYLGENFTIDIRNPNILDELNKKRTITIGRLDTNDIVVPPFYDMVSRQHLRLQKDGDDIIATDLNSTNDTYVVPQNKIEAFYGGVENINIGQGNIGDCYLLATIYSMSQNTLGQKLLKEMVNVDEKGNYIVSFHDSRYPITVKLEELDGQKRENGDEKRSVSGDLGIKAIERAYAKMLKRPQRSGPTMFQEIDNGGHMDTALYKMTGIKSSYHRTNSQNIDKILCKIESDGISNHIITCATPSKGKYGQYLDAECRFLENHAYSIKYIDSRNKRIGIVNPHNTKVHYDISWDEYKEYFKYLYDSYTK